MAEIGLRQAEEEHLQMAATTIFQSPLSAAVSLPLLETDEGSKGGKGFRALDKRSLRSGRGRGKREVIKE
jgi:hypothetical protein